MRRAGWPFFPIWSVVLFAVGLYVAMHVALEQSRNASVPCEATNWSVLKLAVGPLLVVAVCAVAAIAFALQRRPLGVVASRAIAHVVRIVLVLVLAGFSVSLIAVTLRAYAAEQPTAKQLRPLNRPVLQPLDRHPHPDVPPATGSSALTPLAASAPGAAAMLEQASKGQKTCTRALPAYADDHPRLIGLFLFGILIVLGVIVWRWSPALDSRSGSRENAGWIRRVPVPLLHVTVFALLLLWPVRLLLATVSQLGFHVVRGNPLPMITLIASGFGLVWWAISRAFRGLESVVAAASEFARFNSTPHPDYTAKVATEDRADVLVFSDMHLAAIVDGHPLHTMDKKTEAFDDGTTALVEDLVARIKPSAIVVAGDVTDSGHASSWQRAAKLLKRPDIPTYIAPGNHDVHFGWLTPQLVEDARMAVTLVIKEILAADDPRSPDDSVDQAVVARHIDAISPAGKRVKGKHFPIVHQNDSLRLLFLILDSNRQLPASPISNAIGLVGDEQLEDAAELLKQRPTDYGLVIVLHHHVIPPDTLLLHVELRCEDAQKVLEFAAEHRADAIIHGHKHMPYVYRAVVKDHPILVVSCGSTLYDAVGPHENDIKGASAAGLTVRDGHIVDVAFFPATARPSRG